MGDWRVSLYYRLRAAGMHHGQTLYEYLRNEHRRDTDLQIEINIYDRLRSAGMHHGDSLSEHLDNAADSKRSVRK